MLTTLLERVPLLLKYFKVENSFKIKLWLNKSCEVGLKCFYSEWKCSKSHQNEKELVEELKNAQKSDLKSSHYDNNENSESKKCFKVIKECVILG